jgi:hypothetical protein
LIKFTFFSCPRAIFLSMSPAAAMEMGDFLQGKRTHSTYPPHPLPCLSPPPPWLFTVVTPFKSFSQVWLPQNFFLWENALVKSPAQGLGSWVLHCRGTQPQDGLRNAPKGREVGILVGWKPRDLLGILILTFLASRSHSKYSYLL